MAHHTIPVPDARTSSSDLHLNRECHAQRIQAVIRSTISMQVLFVLGRGIFRVQRGMCEAESPMPGLIARNVE